MEGLDDLVAMAIAGVTEELPWQSFVRLLRRHFGASHANVFLRRADLSRIHMTEDNAPRDAGAPSANDLYPPEDDPIPYYRMEPFRAYAIQEMVPPALVLDHPFIAGFLRPLGMEGLLICRVVTPSRLQAWISITVAEPGELGPSQRLELERIARTFAHALALFGTLNEERDQRESYARVVRARATGLLRVDQNGRVLHLDPCAREWVDEKRFVLIVDNHLRAVASENRARLDAALERILDGTSEEELLLLHDSGGEALELLMFRVSEAFEPAWMAATRAVIYLRMTGRESVPTPQRVRTLFNLTRREAALVVLLARGMTLTQSAIDLGISEMTARAYLRQIFQKTGVTRQADLIRQIQASVAAIH